MLSPSASAVLFRRLATLLGAGVQVHRALEFVAKEEDPAVEKVIEAVSARVEGGWRLSQALAEQPQVFSPLTVHLVRAGEESGMLDRVVDRLATYLERSVRLRKQIQAAFTYPAMLLVLTLIIVAVLAAFVFPREKEMLESLGTELPFITKVMIAVMEVLFNPALVTGVMALCALLAATWPWLGKPLYDRHLRLTVDGLLLRVPVLGPILYKAAASRVLSAMATLLRSGMAMVPTLNIVAQVADNRELSGRLLQARETMEKGDGIYQSLEGAQAFFPVVLQLFRVGEEHGRLDDIAQKMSVMLEEEVEHSLSVLASLMEPLALMVMGTVIGFVVLASALPTMSLVQQL